MHELLINPAFQAGIAPFAVALPVGLMLRRAGWFWAGLALMAAFAVTITLTVGFQFQPWTSTRKIIALGFGAAGAGLLLDLYRWDRRWLTALVFAASAAAALWVIWPAVQQREGGAAWLLGGLGALYGGWCAAVMESLRTRPIAAAMGTVAFGFGSGAVTLLGASALLGQMGLALGAAAAALGLLVAFGRKTEIGSLAMLPAGVVLGLIGIGGLVYARVPWYSLVLLAWVPACAWVPVPGSWPRWLQSVAVLVLTGVPAVIAAWLVYRVVGGVPL
jgi:hypothetical protein